MSTIGISSVLDSLSAQLENLDEELDLLGKDGFDCTERRDFNWSGATGHHLRSAPVFTGDALRLLGGQPFPQRAIYGRVISQHGSEVPPVKPTAREVFINTNAPFSAVVCGVQGSGKSHSTSVLLESCLIRNERLGTLPEPLSSLVFHFDTAAGGGLVQPCEAAYLSTLDKVRGGRAIPPPVTVLVLPTNLRVMTEVYAVLPDVTVKPLHFAPEDISAERLLAMMKVDESTQMPLYMEAIMAILRSMDGTFDYTDFRRQLQAQKFNPGQKAMLNLRLSLLDSCLAGGNASNRVAAHFRKGQLTIIDLSSPFMDSSSACGFFDIILGLFVEAETGASGKLVVLDEAHKYLSESSTSSRFTESLLTVVRQQRHLATRVVISTQEPTVIPPKFLELCSFILAHRFSSPKWLKHLAEHVSAAGSSIAELLERIVGLETGYAIMFSPSGLVAEHTSEGETSLSGRVVPLGQGFLVVHSRLRITRDGGHSLLAVRDPEITTRLSRGDASLSGADAHTSIPADGQAEFRSSQGLSSPNSTVPPAVQSGTVADSYTLPTLQSPRALDTANSTSASEVRGGLAHTDASAGDSNVHLTSPPAVPPEPGTPSPIPATLEPLITYLRAQHRAGVARVNYRIVRQELAAGRPPYVTRKAVRAAMKAGAECGVLTYSSQTDGIWLRLTDLGMSGAPHSAPTGGSASSAEPAVPTATNPTTSFAPIVRELQNRRARGELQPTRKSVRKCLKNSAEQPYGTKVGPFNAALNKAVSQGAVILKGEGKASWLELPA